MCCLHWALNVRKRTVLGIGVGSEKKKDAVSLKWRIYGRSSCGMYQ